MDGRELFYRNGKCAHPPRNRVLTGEPGYSSAFQATVWYIDLAFQRLWTQNFDCYFAILLQEFLPIVERRNQDFVILKVCEIE